MVCPLECWEIELALWNLKSKKDMTVYDVETQGNNPKASLKSNLDVLPQKNPLQADLVKHTVDQNAQ